MTGKSDNGRQRRAQGDSNGLPNVAYMPGDVTADNYAQKAIAFLKISGKSDGSYPIIRNREAAERDSRTETRERWCAWMAYFHRIKYPTAFAETLGVMTVPTDWPWQFSLEADTIERELAYLVEQYEKAETKRVASRPKRAADQARANQLAMVLTEAPPTAAGYQDVLEMI